MIIANWTDSEYHIQNCKVCVIVIPILFSQLCYFPELEPLSKVHLAVVVYMFSRFWLLDVGSPDLSQAEKEITA